MDSCPSPSQSQSQKTQTTRQVTPAKFPTTSSPNPFLQSSINQISTTPPPFTPRVQPEMAIALTPFSGFCGFRPLKEISFHLETVPEFAALFPQPLVSSFLSTVCFVTPSVASKAGEDVKDEDKEGVDKCRTKLRELFKSLMEADPEQVVKPNLRKLVARYKKEAAVSDSGSSKDMKKGGVEELVVRLDEQFPDDVGAFCTFVLNIVQLEPGQAVFLKANEPHAYLEGGKFPLTPSHLYLSHPIPN